MFDELLAPLLTTAWGHRAGIAVAVLAGLLLCATLINAGFFWWSDSHILQISTPVKVSLQTNGEQNQLIKELPAQHLFGNAEVVQAEVLPITSLQLRLLGVIQVTSKKLSRVIISEAGRSGKIYQIGDSLSSGVKVHAITPDGVILENGGQLEKLLLDRQPLLFKGVPEPLLL